MRMGRVRRVRMMRTRRMEKMKRVRTRVGLRVNLIIRKTTFLHCRH